MPAAFRSQLPPDAEPTSRLLPPPHEARATGRAVTLEASPLIRLDPVTPELETVRQSLCEGLALLGLRPRLPEAGAARTDSTPSIDLVRSDRSSEAPDHPEGYHLEIAPEGVRLVARQPAGLFYATRTLLQWLRAHETLRKIEQGASVTVAGLRVADRPDLAIRGVLLDVSRCRVPTLAELFRLVDLLSDLKVNQLQLYTEHTFAYRGHEEVWAGASPLTAGEVRALDEHCRLRFVELVPNQNSFGHFHRWLVHERYRPLAEVPEGVDHPFSDRPEPFSLCPTDPRSLELLAGLYDQLLPCFRSRWLNVGLDETLDLGLGRSADACAARGKTAVYLDFLRQVHGLVRERGHRMQLWGDVVLDDMAAGRESEVGAGLPRDAVALAWGYEAGHPFAQAASRLAASGLEFLLCPGTSSWSSLAGRTTNAIENLAEAARTAVDTGARGVLITDWGDFGHLQPPAVSEAPLAAGAAWAWNAGAPLDQLDQLALPLDLHLFPHQDEGSARDPGGSLSSGALRLGNAHRAVGTRDRNGTALFYLLAFAHQDLTHPRYEGLTREGLDRAEAEVLAAAGEIERSHPTRPDGELVVRELLWVARALATACRIGRARLAAGRGAALGQLPGKERRRLAAEVGGLIEELAPLWLKRSRPGGRTESASRLERTWRLIREE